MQARLQLSVIDHNRNVGRAHATTQAGKDAWHKIDNLAPDRTVSVIMYNNNVIII